MSPQTGSGGADADRLARVALSTLTEPGDERVTGLVAELGAPRLHELLLGHDDPRGLSTDAAARLAGVDPAGVLGRAERLGIRYVVPGDSEWPHQVDDLTGAPTIAERGGPPLGLWVRGPGALSDLERSVAIVGSRSATMYGNDVACSVAAVAGRAGQVIVSGGAYGIDGAAHRGALAAGATTVAVLACGVDRAYPAAHRELLDHLALTSLVVSELAPGCAPTRGRFLARNRVIAALTRGTVVVEAAIRSGALNTARWAGRLNRPVMGVPGPVTSAASEGVHALVRAGEALLVTSGEEVLEVVGAAGEHLVDVPRAPVRPRDRLSRRDGQILEAVPVSAPAGVESIARTSGIGLMEVRAVLGRLQRASLVESLPTGWRLGEKAR